MAYSYKQTMDSVGYGGGGYINFNVSPALNSILGVGDTLTISGQAYWKTVAIKSIEVSLDSISIGYVNKSIAKATAGTFSIQITISQEMVNSLCRYSAGNIATRQLSFTVWDTANCDGGGMYTNEVSSHRYRILPNRVAPTIGSGVISDQHPALANSQTPYEYFGGFVDGESLPRFTFSFTTDERDPKLTATHTLEITGGTLAEPLVVTAATAAGASSVVFDLPEPDYCGALSYTYTLVDSAGLSASSSGSFQAFSYQKPSVSLFEATRYENVIDEGAVPSDGGTHVWIDLNGAVSPVAGKNAWSVSLHCETVDHTSPSTRTVTSGTDGATFSYSQDTSVFTAEVSAADTWEFTVVVSDMLNTEQITTLVLKAGGYLDVEKTGVAVGMRSTATAANKKFEVAEDYSAYLYGGIEELFVDWQLVELASGTTTPGDYGPCKLRIGKIGSHVFLRGSVKSKHGNTICIVPEEFRPTNIDNMSNPRYFWFAPTTGSLITRIALDANDGRLWLEWVKKITDATNNTAALTWVQINIDWWLD